jgi:hypothetical protein
LKKKEREEKVMDNCSQRHNIFGGGRQNNFPALKVLRQRTLVLLAAVRLGKGLALGSEKGK